MKNNSVKLTLKLLCTSLFFVGSVAYSQNDTLVSNSAAVWNFKNVILDPNGGSQVWSTYDSLVNDSVLIDNKHWSTYFLSEDLTPTAYILVDSGKVYAKFQRYDIIQDTTSILLLYDFEVEVGDTAHSDPSFGDAVVTHVGDTIVSGQVLKTYHFSNLDVWIEKIGSVNGLLTPLYFLTDFGGQRQLCSYHGEYKDSLEVTYFLDIIDESTCLLNTKKMRLKPIW